MIWPFLILLNLAFGVDLNVSYELTPDSCVDETAEGGERFKRCGAAVYELRGSCAEITSQAQQINPSIDHPCICENQNCHLNLNSILSSPIQKLLKNPHPRHLVPMSYGFEPNCHNTVLHALGFRMGFFESSYDLFYLFASPFCKKREGRPQAGDVIKLSKDHSFFAISDEFALNKSGPGSALPYEIIRIDDYFRQHNYDVSCQFVSDNEASERKCPVTSTAYTCNIPESLRNLEVLGPDARELTRKRDDCEFKEKVLGEKSRDNVESISAILGKMSEDALGINQIKNLPAELVTEIRKAFLESVSDDNKENMAFSFDQNRDRYLLHFSLMASPDMELSHLHPRQRDAILKLRQAGIYSRLPAEERTAWAMILLNQNDTWLTENPRK